MGNKEDIFRVVVGEVETDLKQSVFSNIDLDEGSKVEFNRIKNSWALLASGKEMPPYQIELLYKNFQRQLNSSSSKLNVYSFLKYAAIIIFAVGLSSMYFYFQNSFHSRDNSDQFNTTLVAENGQRSKVILPDSSVVWLNSGTQITYNNGFGRSNREISLTGQAFFHVAKNRELPLEVNCNKVKVHVTGTKFDVSAYSNDTKINVTLESGSVQLLVADNNVTQYALAPGEMAQYNVNSGEVSIKEVEVKCITAWKYGILYFKDSPMNEVITKLERKYNIEIEVKHPKLYNSVFTATIKNETLDEIFRSIGYSCSVNYRIIRGEERDKKTKVIIM